MNKKVFATSGKFYGVAWKIEKVGNDIIVTMPGDFPGMAERSSVFCCGEIVYEDKERIYIDYK